MPSTISLLLIVVGLILIWRNRAHCNARAWRGGALLNTMGAVILYFTCTPLIATWLATSLERMVAPLRAADAPQCDAVVVLGSTFRWHRDQPNETCVVSATTDRFRVAVEAYKLGKAPLLVLGGGGKIDEPAVSEGNFQKQMALELGIPENAIVVGPHVVNTEMEVIHHAAKLRSLHVKKILLATSVFHLPRAAMQFRALGFEVVELPCHYLTAGIDEQFSWRMLLPRGQALDQTETCIKEYFGLVAAKLFPAKEVAVERAP
jgi:uncharacterized SAM-binding protein YcdF (DUF218 family)